MLVDLGYIQFGIYLIDIVEEHIAAERVAEFAAFVGLSDGKVAPIHHLVDLAAEVEVFDVFEVVLVCSGQQLQRFVVLSVEGMLYDRHGLDAKLVEGGMLLEVLLELAVGLFKGILVTQEEADASLQGQIDLVVFGVILAERTELLVPHHSVFRVALHLQFCNA